MKPVKWLALSALLAAAPAMSQEVEIQPVFEHLTNQGVPGMPFMVAQQGTNDFPLGDSDYDLVSKLTRYDENRLLLYVIENGIDETDPEHDAEMASMYPDRTIWWIDDMTGEPMGIALEVGLEPWPNSEYYIQKTTGQHPDGPDSDRSWALTDIYPTIDVDGDGYLYVGNVHNVIRYELDGDTFVNPEKVWNRPEEETENQHYRAWRIWDLNVQGSGDDKYMTVDPRFWIDLGGTWVLSSNDGGESWTWEDEFASGGGASGVFFNPEFEEEYVFNVAFPGRNGGKGFTPLRRYVRPAGTTEEFVEDPADLWSPNRDPAIDEGDFPEPNMVTEYYQNWTACDVATHDGVPYIAVANIPRWQSRNDDWSAVDPPQDPPTAWIALHSVTADPNGDFVEGDFVASHSIPFIEADEPGQLTDGQPGDPWHNAYATAITINVPEDFPEGAFEILWSSGGIGFGRYVVGDVDLDVDSWSLY